MSNPTEDIIFMETDPAFRLPLDALNELYRQNRFGFNTIVASQEAEIINVRSQAEEETQQLIFGGSHKENEGNSRQAFARAFSTVARMCMVEATNMHIENTWMSNPGRKRNKNSIRYRQNTGNRFQLADATSQLRYTSKYDQFYPHFLIEGKLADVNVGQRAELSSMMLIFRNNFTEVVEIVTTANATCRLNDEPGMFESRIYVLCMYRKIKPGTDRSNMVLLKSLCERSDASIQQHLNNLIFGIDNLNTDTQDEDDQETNN